MDLNLQYSEHQKAVINASAAPDRIMRDLHLDRASVIAEEIAAFQSSLGAAAACAWSALKMGPPVLKPAGVSGLTW